MTPILISVQAMEFAWVALNYLGIERTTTESVVRSVADLHLEYMPWSHSVATPVVAALAVWQVIEKDSDAPRSAGPLASESRRI
jgi:hypothetical protein